jgi:hypothetical protein
MSRGAHVLRRGGDTSRRRFFVSSGDGEEPFSPDDIEGLLLWLKADAIEGLSDDEAVATWEDSSSSDNDFTQGTAENRPVYKTNILNSKPIVRCSGENKYLTCATISDTQPFTLWFVMDMTNDANDGGVFFYDEAITDMATDSAGAPNTAWIMDAGDSHHFGLTAGGFHIIAAVFDGASSVGYDDGTGTAGANTGTNAWLIGDTSLGNKFSTAPRDIAEVLFYNSALSTADLNNVGDYLADKYNLTWNPVG